MTSARSIGLAMAAPLLVCCLCLAGEEEDKPYSWRQIGQDARHVPTHFFKAKTRPKLKLAAVAGTTLLLYVARDDIREWAQDHRSAGRSRFLDNVHTMGKGGFGLTLALASYGASFITNNPREKETAVLLLESMGYSAVTAYGGSFILAAERPEDGDSITFFDSAGHGVSLDAALAASVIPPLRRQYLRVRPEDGRTKRFWKRTATALLYGGAILTAYQRVDQDRHWAPDAFLGLATGLNVGRLLCDSHDVATRRSGRLALTAGPGTVGFHLKIDSGALGP
jgi:hypothetical protein